MRKRRVTVNLASLVAVVALLLAGVLMVQARANEASAWQWVTHTREVLERLQEVVSIVRGAESAQRGYLMTSQPAFLEELRSEQSRVLGTVDTVAELTRDNPRQQAAVPELRRLTQQRLDRLGEVIALRQHGNVDWTVLQPGREDMVALERRVGAMMDEEHRLLAIRESQVRRAQRMALATTFGIGTLAFALVVVLRWLSNRDTGMILGAAVRIEAVFRAAPAGLGIVDADLRLAEVNDALAQFLGSPREEAIGQPLAQLGADGLGSNLAAICAHSLHTGEALQGVDLESPAGAAEQRDWLASMQVVDGSPRQSGVVVAMLDVTPLKAAERLLAESNRSLEARVAERTAELRQLNEDLQAFAHTVAHDLRAPLRNIEGFASALAEDEAERLSEDGQAFLWRVRAGVTRMDQLITDLLTYSRLARGDLRLERVSLRSAVGLALRELEQSIADCSAIVEVEAELPHVQASRTLLVQVIVNLVANAIKFVQADYVPRVRLAATSDGSVVRLIVDDNGIGIPAAHRERVFGVFERLHGQETYPGTGIGLAIVRRAMSKMQGAIAIEDSPLGGARIVVCLPAVN